jgi:curved DNA-binding protein CbpA
MHRPWTRQWVDYYELLEVNPKARQAVIVAAHRKLTAHYHPDRPTGDEAMMKRLNAARDVLCDENLRKEYDADYLSRQSSERSRMDAESEARLRAAEERLRQAESKASRAEGASRRAQEEAERRAHDAERAETAPAAPDAGPVGAGGILGQVAGAMARAWLENRSAERAGVERSAATISGDWQGSDGNRYRLMMSGTRVTIQGMNRLGMIVVTGVGTLRADTLTVQYRSADLTFGVAELVVDPSGRRLSGTVTNVPRGVRLSLELVRGAGW